MGLVLAVDVAAVLEDVAASLEVGTVEVENDVVDSSCCETVATESVDIAVVVVFICKPTTLQLSDRAPSIATPAATALSPLQKEPSFDAKMYIPLHGEVEAHSARQLHRSISKEPL